MVILRFRLSLVYGGVLLSSRDLLSALFSAGAVLPKKMSLLIDILGCRVVLTVSGPAVQFILDGKGKGNRGRNSLL